jgi:DNA-binding transcriptional LysR family regulator
MLPSLHAEQYVAGGRLFPVLDSACPPSGALWAVYPSRRHLTPAVRAFIAFIREHLARFSGAKTQGGSGAFERSALVRKPPQERA